MKRHCHGGARQASDLWTAAASSLLALISREHAYFMWQCCCSVASELVSQSITTNTCLTKGNKKD